MNGPDEVVQPGDESGVFCRSNALGGIEAAGVVHHPHHVDVLFRFEECLNGPRHEQTCGAPVRGEFDAVRGAPFRSLENAGAFQCQRVGHGHVVARM